MGLRVLKGVFVIKLILEKSMKKTTENIRRAENVFYRSCMDIPIKFVFEALTE
jgi:hypothetical protein